MKAIVIENLKKVYSNGTEALKGIDFEVDCGDFCALLGANGAGKTTIISIMTGLVRKTSGDVSVFGHNIDQNHGLAKQMIGVVPQEMNFNMFERVQDIVVNQAGFFGIARDVATKNSERILKRLELWEKREQPSRTLSGGMKRRLMIARALINNPKLLILDEPTAGVDVELRHSMWNFLRELNEQGTTILLTTHYLEEVEQMCRNAAIIKNGKIISSDTVRNLVRLLEVETYVIHVDKVVALDALSQYRPKKIDDNTFEIEFDKKDRMQHFLGQAASLGMEVTDLRPKGNRMEKLYLKILNH